MGNFIAHIVPGLALTLLGLWHTINTTRSYCNNKTSTNFIVKFWHPFNCPFSRLKYVEPILILSFCILSVLDQIFDFPLFRFSFELVNLEHATMFLHLAIFAGFILCTEITRSSHILSSFTGILATSLFSQELFLLHFHSADHVGLEGHYHWLLQLIIFTSLLSALAATFLPTSFPAALGLSVSVVFQGCWFMNMGCMLWLPQFVPQGCSVNTMLSGGNSGSVIHGAVTCESSYADHRARALANLQFSWILCGIMLVTGCLCLKSAGKSTRSLQQYEQLNTIRGGDSPVTIIEGFK
ncbi:unnamed protein product [Linum trigynum]|uniref:Transmembrane protein 45B n=1 Tax=Linum trigynum TaxID=586398 RepID=A0AAV2DFW9_9ROSI